MTGVVSVYIIVGHPDTEATVECSACGFDSLLTFPLTGMSESGVGPWGTYEACARCWESTE